MGGLVERVWIRRHYGPLCSKLVAAVSGSICIAVVSSIIYVFNKTQVTRTTYEPPHNRTHERNTRPKHLAAIGGCATTVRATLGGYGT